MPELPEVETTRCGIAPHITGKFFTSVIIRQPRLRWPIPDNLPQLLVGQKIESISRRAKYLLLSLTTGTLLIHLGMSGSLRVVTTNTAIGPHDHADFLFCNHHVLRYTDPRRFGAILWLEGDPLINVLLKNLGPEPLSNDFSGDYLRAQATGRKVPIKRFIMDGKVVVGVGNIYANEALFKAGIHPKRAAGRISLLRHQLLAQTIKTTLSQAIACGGTTLKDFVGSDGKPGYFKQALQVYGRGGQPCLGCGGQLREVRLGQRSTVFCVECQK